MPTVLNRVIACAAAVATLAAAGTAAGETLIRVRNDSVQPANITVDKKSRDVRARKASNFPLTSTTASLKVVFANGDMSMGEFDVGLALPVKNPKDGDTYYCMTLDEDDFEILPQEACAEWVIED